MHIFKTAAVAAVLATTAGIAHADETLDAVKEKGFVQCGVSQGLPGFSNPDDQGNWTGLDVDFCRAMASAIFNDADAVKFTPLSAKVRFTALTSGEIDVLSRNTLDYTVVAFEKADEVVAAYDAGRCDVYTTDRSGLAAQRTKLSAPDDHMVLPEIISKEPLGPLVRHGDNQWGDIARWTLNCMINAEEAGIDSSNVGDMATSDNPGIKRIVGADGDLGSKIGLDNTFCANVIANVGNYGESYNRNVGPDTPLKLDRGVNALWSDGGLLYAAPQR